VRLSEDRIKEAILDTDSEIRHRAVRYFAKSFSSDTSVVPLVIEAVETFGREDAYHLIGSSSDLPQTEETIDWFIGELNDSQNAQHENYTFNLSRILVKADIALLLPNESAILDSLHFLDELKAPLTERLQMLSWDETTCWRELETLCEDGKDKRYINEVNLDYGRRIVEALSRYGDECEDRVHELLRQKVEDYSHDPMKWLEPLVVRLAGETHLESTIPLLVSKLIEDSDDLMNEACAESLTRIGKPAVVNAVSEAYATAPRHFRNYAIDPLENIHSDLAVETCLNLLRQEQDTRIRVDLAYALLSHFAQVGVVEARNLLVGRSLDFESRELRNYLVETCTITGERFPEYDDWKTAERVEKEEHWKRVNELKDDPLGLMQFAFGKLNQDSTTARQEKVNPPETLQHTQKVGRNAPCPCGSGKKFKKCCLNESS
jgi:hypothetical protein